MKNFIKEFLASFLRKFARYFVEIIYGEIKAEDDRRSSVESEKLLGRLQSRGVDIRINGRIFISEPRSLVIGNNVHIGDNAYFITEGGLTIGDNTHISRNVTVYTTNHDYLGNALPYDNKFIYKPVAIGKNVWIGMNVSIIPGVTLGDGAIIGMGTVVTKDVPPLAIVGNPPSRVIKYRDRDHYERLEESCNYGGINGEPLPMKKLTCFGRSADDPEMSLFFVVSTGRSGSMTIANVLSQHPDIECNHEHRSQLIRLSTEYAHGLKNLDQTKEELYSIFCNSSSFYNRIYGESDQKFWNLIVILMELLPSSQFIWLIRDARMVVASSYSRGWFSQEEKQNTYSKDQLHQRWIDYRLDGAKCGEFEEEEWEQSSAFEKNCWYWAHVNKNIEKQLKSLSADRWLMVRLEGVKFKMNNIWELLRVSPVSVEMKQENTADYKLKTWEEWNESEKEVFEKWCGEGMDRWYQGWREHGNI